ncbi:histidinol-phosphate aminotransferase [Allopseudospirillum japonicum]|uniref:Histidinol-phosphate aminotransferase n=2 Tax=Allopseudospirillum japonicum TaxID=64971 RepID=A0A1H6QFX1_9GAMM|nr:histidinol-phosphate aminotransferase [Allopseudospirillum japonicum]
MQKSAKDYANTWVRPEIQALNAYPVPNAQGMLKLDAMESPYVWPADEHMQQAWQQALQAVAINRYPAADAQELKQKLRQAFAIGDHWEILLGNGSDEIIQLLALAVAGSGRSVLAPEPSFVMFKMIATFVGMDYIGVPLNTDFSLDLQSMLTQIRTHQPALIFLAQPNNPTGNLYGEAAIAEILQTAQGLVVLDEAYTAFTDADYLPWLEKYPNLVVMRTLSKVGLAGLRLGFLVGAPAWINEIEKLRLPYNINTLTQASAVLALNYFDILKEQCQQIRQQREILSQALIDLHPEIEVFASEANFILIRMAQAGVIFQKLKEKGVLIKCLDGAHPLLHNCLRISVSTAEENQIFLQAFASVLAQGD